MANKEQLDAIAKINAHLLKKDLTWSTSRFRKLIDSYQETKDAFKLERLTKISDVHFEIIIDIVENGCHKLLKELTRIEESLINMKSSYHKSKTLIANIVAYEEMRIWTKWELANKPFVVDFLYTNF